MWTARSTQILIEGNAQPDEALEWIRRALPLFEERLLEAFVTGSRVPNGTLLLDLTFGAADFSRFRRAPTGLPDFTRPAPWTWVSSAFGVGIAQLASLAGKRATVVDVCHGGSEWSVVALLPDAGAQQVGNQGRVLKDGEWTSDEDAGSRAGELITQSLGRSIWTFADYIDWWQSTFRQDLAVVIPPKPVMWRGRRVPDFSRDPRITFWTRARQWLRSDE